MQAAEDGLADDFAVGLYRPWNRRVFIQRHVCASDVVIVVEVPSEYGSQVYYPAGLYYPDT